MSEKISQISRFSCSSSPAVFPQQRSDDISGRGVGMDVVKREVEKLRGKISVETEAGKGTAFLIKLPLTTSIIEGLVVRLGENRLLYPFWMYT